MSKRIVASSIIQNDKQVENFELLDHTGKAHELYYYSNMKAIVLISQANGCPITRRFIPALNQLKKEFESRDVLFLMINANPQDDRKAITEEVEKFNINIPILEDRAQIISESLNYKRTAEVLIIAPSNWSVLYHGTIDESLKDNLLALLNNDKIISPSNTSQGTPINFTHKSKVSTHTFNQDVAPILENKCLRCHSTGGSAPWAMNDYETVKGWAPMIREVIRTKRMPPYKIDPYYGEFKNDMSLTTEEIRTLTHWVEQGFKRGEGKDYLHYAPKPKHSEWPLGEPDIIVTINKEQKIPATGVQAYRYIEGDKIIEKDIWVRSAQIMPGTPQVLHHSVAIVQPPDSFVKSMPDERIEPFVPKKDWEQFSGFILRKNQDYRLHGYIPGSDPYFFPDNTGRFIPKGSKIIFELHYTPNGKPESDLTRLGLYTYEEKPAHILLRKHLLNMDFIIPPHEKEFKVTSSGIFEKDILLYILRVHMHFRGKSVKFLAEYPDGTSEILLSIPDYDYYWQHPYILKEPKRIPAGTRVLCNAVFDNSGQNPSNPDPSQHVKWGPQDDDEMFGCHFYHKVIEKDDK